MSEKTDRLLESAEFQTDLRSNETIEGVAKRHGVSMAFIHKHRHRALESAETQLTELREQILESSNGARSVEAYKAIRTRPVTLRDAREWIKASGDDPEDYTLTIRSIAYGRDQFSNKMSAVPLRKAGAAEGGPEWPVIQPAERVAVEIPAGLSFHPRDNGLKLGAKCGDPQIGFRRLPDGTLDPFHDQKAMDLFVEVCRLYQPEKITILGDFLDLASQGRFAQEASFALTTQLAINAGHVFLSMLRAVCPDAEIILIEGNHDLRMQNFIEANALAAFGLKPANMPESWPVMSLPFLLRLEELNIQYVDAYPAATDWDNDLTRNIHGTKANSKGSTMAQYVHELPHVNTWAGHTHRAEVVYRTVLGARGEPIESYAANPGVLCRTDGAVPSVKGAIGASGIPTMVVEDWQQGFGMNWYNDTISIPAVYRIRNGSALVDGTMLSV